MAKKWVTEDELNYMKMGGKVVYAQEGATAQGGGDDQVMQLIQAYAQAAGVDPKELMAQLQQMSPEQQQQAIQNMAKELQGGQEGQEQNQSPQEEQAEMQGGGQEEMMQQIAQAIQQGADPQQVMGALVQQGVPEEQAGQMIQAISQQMQGAPQMAMGGSVSPEKAKQILKDGTIYGKSLTDKQRRFFGAMANKSEDGNTIVNFDSAATTQTAPIEKNKDLKNRGTVNGENTRSPFREYGGTAFYDEARQDAVQRMIQGGNLHTYEGKNIKAKNGAKIKAQLGTIVGKSIPESTAVNRVLQPIKFQMEDPAIQAYMKKFGTDRKTAEKAIAINQAGQAANKPSRITQGYKETSKQKADRIKKNEAYVKANSNFAMLDDNGNIVPKTDQYSISGKMLPGAADARAAKKIKTTLGILGAGAAAPFVLPEVAALSSAATPFLNIPLVAGITPSNLVAGYSAYEGAHNLPHFTESYKKAWENPSAANVGNAATQTGIQALNFLPAFHNLKALAVAEDLAGKETLEALAKHKVKHLGLEEASQQLSEENSHKAKGGYVKPYFYDITIPGPDVMGPGNPIFGTYKYGGTTPYFYDITVKGPEVLGPGNPIFGTYADKGGNIKTSWDNYRTKLSKAEEKEFSKWKSKLPERLQSDQDYDLKGFFKAYGKEPIPKGEEFHLTDEFKLPNHPTFSSQSKYYNDETKYLGGEWLNRGDSWLYQPNSGLKKPIYEQVPNEEIRRNFMQIGRPGVRRSDFTWDFSDPYAMESGGNIRKPYFYDMTIPGSDIMGPGNPIFGTYAKGGKVPYFYDITVPGPDVVGPGNPVFVTYAKGGTVPEGYHVMPSGRLMSDKEHKPNGNVGEQDLRRFMTGNNSIQGGQGSKIYQYGGYATGGLVPGGVIVGDKEYYPYGGYVEYNSEGGAPSQVGNRAEWLAKFGTVYPVKADGGIGISNKIDNIYDFSKTTSKNPFLATPKDNNDSKQNTQQGQNKQEIQPITPKGATPLPTNNAAQTVTMPSTNSNTMTSTPDVRNYKNAVAAGVTNIDEFMRYKRTGYPNPPQIQQYGGYTRIAQWGDTAQELTQPTTVNANWMDVSSTPPSPIVGQKQFNVDPNQANTQQNVAAAKAVTSGPPAGLSKGLSSMNPVSMGLNAAGGAMDATANLMASLGKEGSGAQAFGKGASEAMGVAGQITAPFKDIPVVGQALDVAGKVLGFLIGGPLEKRSADIRKEENKKAEKYADWAVRNQPSMVANQGQYMAKYGKNVSNYKQRIMDDIYNDFDKYMKK